jgi:catechol 2,3-dioxygenase-like lactoylglutathione lyase family enzyme
MIAPKLKPPQLSCARGMGDDKLGRMPASIRLGSPAASGIAEDTPMSTFVYDHIHLRSPDPEATARYYERMFGAEVIRTEKNGQKRIDLKLGGADIFIAPVARGDGVNPPPTTPYQGLDHFGLRVTGIEAVVADLKAKGAEFTMELNEFRPGVHICFIRGPEGVSIEVLERKPA